MNALDRNPFYLLVFDGRRSAHRYDELFASWLTGQTDCRCNHRKVAATARKEISQDVLDWFTINVVAMSDSDVEGSFISVPFNDGTSQRSSSVAIFLHSPPPKEILEKIKERAYVFPHERMTGGKVFQISIQRKEVTYP